MYISITQLTITLLAITSLTSIYFYIKNECSQSQIKGLEKDIKRLRKMYQESYKQTL